MLFGFWFIFSCKNTKLWNMKKYFSGRGQPPHVAPLGSTHIIIAPPMIYAILFKQLLLQMRTHIGGVECHIIQHI